jgi:pimeloyl-ACP methyl ester carboxylesterase
MYQKGELPRRAFLGIQAIATDDGRAAVRVSSVEASGPAERAGVRAGDEIVRVGGDEIRTAAELAARVRRVSVGECVEVVLERGGERVDVMIVPEPRAIERFDGAETRLSFVQVHGHRLRTIAVTPPAARAELLFLPGLGAASCESPAVHELVLEWARERIATVRLERSGVGDSEGLPPSETDFEAEVEGYRAALDTLGDGVFLFGYSVGGMIAPLLARERTIAGIVVFGTSALRWHDSVAVAAARQAIDPERRDHFLELHALVCKSGLSSHQALEKRPDLRPFASGINDKTVFGRPSSFFHQLERAEVAAAWRAVRAPVLVLRGENDVVCGAEEGRAIAAMTNGSFRELAGTGHELSRAVAREAALWIAPSMCK